MNRRSQKLIRAREGSYTTIISGFPGVGKSYACNSLNYYNQEFVYDSDSSKFDKSDFPANYIRHIEDMIYKGSTCVPVSSHEVVRKALADAAISYTIVYPSPILLPEYLRRYRERGSPQAFLDLIAQNWSQWILNIRAEKHLNKIQLDSGQYLSNVIEDYFL